VQVVFNERNLGVGGATMEGFRVAIASNATFIVKIDGDGQMDARLVPIFIECLESGADYAKGNRFFEIESLSSMPRARLIGNVALSFLTKLSTGYWNIFDPNNGFVAINAKVAMALPFEKIAKRYFFESDMLFRLGLLRAVVIDVPMNAIYADEISNLRVFREIPTFLFNHIRNLLKRIFYNYFLRDFSIASVELVLGTIFLFFGMVFGISNWVGRSEPATAGTVMLAALPTILGFQLLMGFVSYDIRVASVTPLAPRLATKAIENEGA
jgi:hypothetical protein